MAILPHKSFALPLAALALAASMGARGGETPDRWWAPGEGRVLPAVLDYENDHGTLRTLVVGGPLKTKGHPFFEPLGPNGRACVTCHQPADAMSLSVESVRRQWDRTKGKDPLFAAIDGSNCPTLPQEARDSHSLLLDRGLFRIERPWPVTSFNGRPVTPDFTIDVVRDPNGCNSGPAYGPAAGKISVYRRPRPVANMKYLLAVGFPYDPKQGYALPLDPDDGKPQSGNLMADNRAGNLRLQMEDAASSHLQMLKRLGPAQRKRLQDFELRVFTAMQVSKTGGAVDTLGAKAGPARLRDSQPGALGSIGEPVWSEFAGWEKISPDDAAKLTPRHLAFRQSVARGARVFRDKTFLITDTAGINSRIGFGNPVRNSCVFCHNMSQMGNDVAPGQVDLGTTTLPFADPWDDLPLFRITCTGRPHPHYGRVIYTYDPGFALTSGKCADVGKITLQSMRGLSARAPYFSNGLARDLRGIVDYYERRYSIGYTEQEKQDLVNLMSVL
ncbi:hypothetical protein Saro_3404 (plasmid) [Novosphingobium aromaticivorans DSM 12444]|uniref:Cytochrome c domain-containing protein n=1 Tax=Novosphingobium aromaticivorans (strain ATCC 700278 / DSM 12444 / CCUG 56034 / CIP 105152 / NBRC 16084 / F199) TaxID=279238 RepID=A4XEA3_NOVAD|nr:hypothetical protein [Novosphingobium aromaticivorans]ABP64264.1 hypothetical protein Saro_3404 [Novosphingobium aromaticivorans DSM 12444]SCY80713.1 hypothetical protein SAMN05660666_02993 [Novosphingobium aromaticivorans]